MFMFLFTEVFIATLISYLEVFCTLRSCMRQEMMPMKLPPASVLRVSADVMYSSYRRRCRRLSRQRTCTAVDTCTSHF